MRREWYVKDMEMRSTLIKICQFGFFRCDSKPLFLSKTVSRGSMSPRLLSSYGGCPQRLRIVFVPISVPTFPEVVQFAPSCRYLEPVPWLDSHSTVTSLEQKGSANGVLRS